MAQGTIKEYDEANGTGSLLLDDATEIRIDPVSTRDSGLRTLRLGQRVRFELEGDGDAQVARKLRILTID